MLGLGLGMGVGNNAPLLPVSAFPTIAAIPPGALVLDSDGVVKEKRFVVELNGPDTLTVLPLSTDLKNTNWEIQLCFMDANKSQTGPSQILRILDSTNALKLSLAITTDKKLTMELWNGTSWVYGVTTSTVYNSSYNSIVIKKNGSAVSLTALGETKNISSTTSWAYAQIGSVKLSDVNTDVRPLRVCGITQSLNGVVVDKFACKEEYGASLENAINPERPATLSDATAHVGDLVPVSLLS